MPMRRAVRITRQAISPLLAMRILENILSRNFCGEPGEKYPKSVGRAAVRIVRILEARLELGGAWIPVHPAVGAQYADFASDLLETRVDRAALRSELVEVMGFPERHLMPCEKS